jgi:PST family polysaccharide transporter
MPAPEDPTPSSFNRGTLTRTVAKEATSTFFLYLVDRLIQLLVIAILSRLLTPADYGVVAAAGVFLVWLNGLSQMGVSLSLVQAHQLTPRMIAVGQTILLGTSLFFFLLVELSAPFVGAWFHNPAIVNVLRVLGVALLLQALTGVPEALMMRELRARDLRLVEVLSSVVAALFVAVPMAFLGYGYWALVALTLMQPALKLVALQLMVSYPRRPGFHLATARHLMFRGGGFSLVSILNLVAKSADNLIVGRYMSVLALGYYSRAYTLSNLPTNLYSQVADRVVFPAIARVQHEPERLRRAFLQGISLTAMLGIPSAILMIATAPELIRLLLGQKWTGTVGPFLGLSIAIYFRLSYKVVNTMIIGIGPVYTVAMLQGVYAISIIAVCLLCFPYGVFAVAAGVSMAIIFNWVLAALLSLKRVGVDLWTFARAHAPGISLGVLLALAAFPLRVLCGKYGLPDFATFAIVVAGSGVAVGAGALVAPRLFLGEHGQAASAIVRDMIAGKIAIFRRR